MAAARSGGARRWGSGGARRAVGTALAAGSAGPGGALGSCALPAVRVRRAECSGGAAARSTGARGPEGSGEGGEGRLPRWSAVGTALAACGDGGVRGRAGAAAGVVLPPRVACEIE